jgi:excisionase family DNA binding protein
VTGPPAPLVRPSQLARFWEIHPRTLHIWIREGRLAAIRSPGNHFRLRVADVRAFCEREGLPVPPFVSPPARSVVVAAASPALRRILARAFHALGPRFALEALADPYEALVSALVGHAAILALGASTPHFDTAAAVRALKKTPAASGTAVVVFDVTNRPQALALERAGAARAFVQARTAELLPIALRELLGEPPAP